MYTIWFTLEIVLGVGYFFALYSHSGKWLTPTVRRVLLALTAVQLVVIMLHMYVTQFDVQGFPRWYFNIGTEFALGATFSTVQLAAVALLALVIALLTPKLNYRWRLYWLFMAALFALLTLDEYYQAHENVFIDREILFMMVAAAAMAFVLVSVWFGFRNEPRVRALIIAGFFFMGAALVVDSLLINTPQESALEEFLEMNGVTLVLIAFLAYAQPRMTASGWKWSKVVPVAGAALWGLWLIANFWVFPTIEYKLYAQPVNVEYLDGELALVGYRMEQEAAAPGDTIEITFYWKANRPITKVCGFSAHLLSHPEVESFSHDNVGLVDLYTTENWLPGIIVKHTVELYLRTDLKTPASYWLQINVWENIPGEFPVIDVAAHDTGWLLEPNALILSSVPVLFGDPPLLDATESEYRFSDNFTLYGYDLPATIESGEVLPLRFWWQTTDKVNGQYTQFIHVFAEGGETFIDGYDRQPFDSSFPTVDWPADVGMMDSWDVVLPDDLSPGVYHIYTGMYDSDTVQRLSVAGGEDTVRDNVIYLGTVAVG